MPMTERERRQRLAADLLAAEVMRRAEAGEAPLTLAAAVDVLREAGLGYQSARMVLGREAGTKWRLAPASDRSGRRTFVQPLGLTSVVTEPEQKG